MATNIENYFEIEREKEKFYSECKRYNYELYFKRGNWFRNFLLQLISKKMATRILLRKVHDVINHNIHQDYKIDVLWNGRFGRGMYSAVELPDYRIRLKANPKIQFIVKGAHPHE